jgi:phenylalanyl-tRNA synthetase beta chain
VLKAFDLEPPVFVLELDVEALEKHLPGTRRYRDVPRYPAVKRDLSLVVPAGVSYGDVHAAVTQTAGPSLESLLCFDVYRGEATTTGPRSIGLRLRFRDPARTLADADVVPVIDAIVRELERSLGVRLRSGA